jgi:hypothetical protein
MHLTWLVFTTWLVTYCSTAPEPLSTAQLQRLTSFGIAARENGQVIVAGRSYFLHTTISWSKWATLLDNAIALTKQFNSALVIAFPTAPATLEYYTDALTAYTTQLEEIKLYLVRQLKAVQRSSHPAWNKLLRYKPLVTFSTITAQPTLAANSLDITLSAQCFDHTSILTPKIEIKKDDWASDVTKWSKPAEQLLQQLRDLLMSFTRFQFIFHDLRQGKFPQTCISDATWIKILTLMKVPAADHAVALNQLLARLAIIPTTMANVTKELDIDVRSILPIMPTDPKMEFNLYYMTVSPIPFTKKRWQEFGALPWVAINHDITYMAQFSNLDLMNEGCLAGLDIWWCFESFPLTIIQKPGCWSNAITGPKPPEDYCYTKIPQPSTAQITDLTANRYLLAATKPVTLQTTCYAEDLTSTETQDVPIAAGVTVYELSPRCSANLLWYHLPTNWYIPTTTEDNLAHIIEALDTSPDPADTPAAPSASQQAPPAITTTTSTTPQSILSNIANTGPRVFPAGSMTGYRVRPLISDTSVVTDTGSRERPIAKDNSGVADAPAPTLQEWVKKEFDFGDTISMVLSACALFTSTLLIIKNWCLQRCSNTAMRFKRPRQQPPNPRQHNDDHILPLLPFPSTPARLLPRQSTHVRHHHSTRRAQSESGLRVSTGNQPANPLVASFHAGTTSVKITRH